MPVTGAPTNFDLCTDALRKIGVVSVGSPATAEEIETAQRALGRMLKAWQARTEMLWATTSMTVTLTTAGAYTLTPARPVDIVSVRLMAAGQETTLRRMTRDEWDRIGRKATASRPTSWYYDRQREAGTLRVWPQLATPAGQTLAITYTRELEDVVLADAADVPGEWADAVVYGLAARLADDFMVNAPSVIARAEDELDKAMAFDREGSVYFVDTEWSDHAAP